MANNGRSGEKESFWREAIVRQGGERAFGAGDLCRFGTRAELWRAVAMLLRPLPE